LPTPIAAHQPTFCRIRLENAAACCGTPAAPHFPGGILALMAFFGSTLVACALDRPRTASVEGVLGLLRQHGARILLFAVVIACAGALVWILLLAKPGVSWWNVLYTERNIVRVLSEDWLTALRQIFVYSGYALGITYFGLNIPGLTSFFQFACHTLLGLPVRDAYRASANAQMKNFMPVPGSGCCSSCCRSWRSCCFRLRCRCSIASSVR
jgi:hypothetical protein